MSQRARVILYHPIATPTKRFVTPLSMLAVAAPLNESGYEVSIVDANTDDGWRETIASLAGGALCAGITALTGYQLHNGLAGARILRAANPRIRLVWGGYQPSLYPDQAMADSHVDFAVKGLGEMPMLSVCDRLRENADDFSGVQGLTWRSRDGSIVRNPDQPLLDINRFPSYPWQLVDLERYVQSDFSSRALCYNTSMSCPFGCAFCGVISAFPRGWVGYTAERVLDEVEYLVKRHHLDGVPMLDNNFFVERKRLERICDGFVRRVPGIQWMAMGRARDFLRMDRALLPLMKRSGLKCVFIGAESGSDEVLELINKELTVEEIVQCTELLTAHDVIPHYSFTLGYPPEPAVDIEASIALIRRIKKINPESQVNLMYYTPYYGTPLYRWAQNQGFDEPQQFDQWSEMNLNSGKAPWMTDGLRDRVHRFDMILRTAFPHEDWRKQQIAATAPIRALMQRIAMRRWENGSLAINDLRVLHRANSALTRLARLLSENGSASRWAPAAQIPNHTMGLPTRMP